MYLKQGFQIITVLTIFLITACDKGSDGPKPIVIKNSISDSVVFKKVMISGQPDYVIENAIEINAPVIIEPGVVIEMKSGASIRISNNGSLTAVGNADKKIIFQGEIDSISSWEGIVVSNVGLDLKSGAGDEGPVCRLIHCEIRNAGVARSGDTAVQAAIRVEGNVRLVMQNSHIYNSGGYGINITSAASRLDSFTNNTIEKCLLAPVRCPVNSFYALDSLSTFNNNNFPKIEGYYIQNEPLNKWATWQRLDVPYFLPPAIITVNGRINVLPGTHIQPSKGSGIKVSKTGSLKCVGDLSNFIMIEPATQEKGYWAGIQISSYEGSKFSYVLISGGGSDFSGFSLPIRKSNIEITYGGRLEITYCNIKNSSGYGINILKGGIIVDKDNYYSGNILGNKYIAQ